MYSWILQERPKGNRLLLYELNFKEYESKANLTRASMREVAFSDTLKYFYGIPALISALYLIVQLIQICPCQGG